MASLAEALDELQSDLTSRPMRIAAHSDMPFAVFCYPPREEFELRKHLRLLAVKLSGNHGLDATFISLSRIVWDTIRAYGESDLFETERLRGFDAAQLHVNTLLTSPSFKPVYESVLERMQGLSPEKHVVFLVRAGGFAPYICRTSLLLDQLHKRTLVPVILFYPGSAAEGTDLRFYDLPIKGTPGVYNYRVKIYGARP